MRCISCCRGCCRRSAGARKRWPAAACDNRQFNDYVKDGPLTQFFEAPDTVWTPRVLKDGADSVGALGALNRVYHQHRHVQRRVAAALQRAGRRQARHADHDRGRAEELRLLQGHRSADAGHGPVLPQDHRRRTISKDAPGGDRYLSKDEQLLTRGKVAFAENCARCHSSKTVPPPVPGLDPTGCAGKDYLAVLEQLLGLDRDAGVQGEDAGRSSWRRISSTTTTCRPSSGCRSRCSQTNACSPLATNAIGGNIWDNFSSQSYKDLPSVGEITWYHPYTGAPQTYTMPAGGRGYTRPPSLVSLWSTAPFLLNNSVGRFESSPSVEARMRSFQDSIEQMLWPEKRDKDSLLGDKIPGMIDRTPEPTYLRVASGYLPDFLQKLPGERLLPKVFSDGGIEIGPIPTGTPINLLANVNLLSEGPDPAERLQYQGKVGDLVVKVAEGPGARSRRTPPTSRPGRRSRISSTRCSR